MLMALFHDLTDYVEIPPVSENENATKKAASLSISPFAQIPPLEQKYLEPSPSFAPPQGKKFRGGRAKSKEAIKRNQQKKAKKRQSEAIRSTYKDLFCAPL